MGQMYFIWRPRLNAFYSPSTSTRVSTLPELSHAFNFKAPFRKWNQESSFGNKRDMQHPVSDISCEKNNNMFCMYKRNILLKFILQIKNLYESIDRVLLFISQVSSNGLIKSRNTSKYRYLSIIYYFYSYCLRVKFLCKINTTNVELYS